jgi:hypothetical protein
MAGERAGQGDAAVGKGPSFVGREEVIFEIDRWLADATDCVLITGAPGTGKTALLQHYVERLETAGVGSLLDSAKHLLHRGAPGAVPAIDKLSARLFTKKQNGRRLVPQHFSHGSTRPRDVMRSLADRVDALFPEAARPDERDADTYLKDLLKRVAPLLEKDGKQLVLVTDALDANDEAVKTFARLPIDLPGISFLLSARSRYPDDFEWIAGGGTFARVDLDDPKWHGSNHELCVRYAEKAVEQLHPNFDIDALARMAQGNIRYLVDLVDELRDRPTAPLDLIPPRFRNYLEHFLDSISLLPREHQELVRDGLVQLAAAPDALPHTEIAARAGWGDAEATESFLRHARSVLVTEEVAGADPKYRLFHPAFGRVVAESFAAGHSGDSRRDVPPAPPPAAASAPQPAAEVPIPARAAPAIGPIAARFFLGIGADDYVEPQLRDLGFCGNDATGLASALSAFGFSVTTLHDGQQDRSQKPTLFNVRAALAALKGRLSPNDLLWVHFSSHGTLDEAGQAYLLATDSRSADLVGTALAVADVLVAIKASGARRWLLTLDACHCGVVTGRDTTISRLDPSFIHNVSELADGGAVFAASTAAQRAEDSADDRHGVFTTAMLQSLGRVTKGGILTLDDLKGDVINRVRAWDFTHLTGAEPQTPSFRIEGTGDLILVDARQPESG